MGIYLVAGGLLSRVTSAATVLVDCLTLWLSQIFEDESDAVFHMKFGIAQQLK